MPGPGRARAQDAAHPSQGCRTARALAPAPRACRRARAGLSGQPGDGERHRIDLEAPDALQLTGDRDRIEQVVSHLIANAVKFSPQGGTVRVRVEQRGAEASVTVADEGIGIAAEEIAQLGTRPFVRAERAKGYAGIGAGLYLARVVAEGHGGRMEITSEGDDKGTTARLTLAL
ncbi:MAG: ATP-binding protein [Chloroflexi bacterium]|nr:ATP-binding protein [Chloroflexota bacterium]